MAVLAPENEQFLCPESKRHFFTKLVCEAKQMKRPSHLPEEVIEEILLRLSPESLIECKRVCKAWYGLIRDPAFVNKHLLISINSNEASPSMFFSWNRQELSLDDIFVQPFVNNYRDQVLSLVTINGDCFSCVVEQLDLPPVPSPSKSNGLSICTYFHCNGIVCAADDFYYRRETIVLCNPALREVKLLPRSPLIHGFVRSGYGFGYDCEADDYKYVRVLCSPKDSSFSRAQIYSLRTNSWREIKIDLRVRDSTGRRRGIYLRGFYYWWDTRFHEDKGTMIVFDMSKEEFKTIPLPEIAIRASDWKSLAVWNESVALFLSRENSWFSTSFEMWVMVAGDGIGAGGSPSWSKYLTIGPLARVQAPVAFWKRDELLMETRDGLIVSYNIYSHEIRKLPFPGAVFPEKSQAGFYVKSVVSLKRNILNR